MTTLIQRIIKRNYEVKIWHLIIFNLFFSFIGSFISLYSGQEYYVSYIISFTFGVLFVSFLIFINGRLLLFITKIYRSQWLMSIFVGFVAGVILWYSTTLYKPIVQLSLANCNFESCHTILQNYYSDNTIQYDQVSWYLVVWMLLQFVVITPISEELLYRSAMVMIFAKRYSLVISSLLIAAIFAVFHLRYFIPVFVFSLVMSALVLKYRNILPAVVAHGTFNTLIYFLFPPIKVSGDYSNIEGIDIAVFIFLLVGCFFGAIQVIKSCSLDWLEEPSTNLK